MDSPILPTIDAALLKAISVAYDIHGDGPFNTNVRATVRAVFRQEITTLKAALLAEDKSRRIAIEELRHTVREALEEFELAKMAGDNYVENHAAFWNHVNPWLERVER